MRLNIFTALFLCTLLIMQSINAFAFETDQYNLPPQPLADIGNEVSEYAQTSLRKAVDKINAEIQMRQACLEKPAKQCESADKNRKKLEELRSGETVAHEVYKILGSGILPFTNSGSWLESHHFSVQPVRYKTGLQNSIFLVLPLSYVGLASTINLYGSQFGTDKIAHLFQQGFDYYKIYLKAVDQGFTPEQAIDKAVRWGQKTEHTFYGTWISGVYSNADLAANYAGLKFYLGLTQEIKIDNATRPAVLDLNNGIWDFNKYFKIEDNFLKPFISDHLNEALNPSVFTQHFGLRSYVRHVLKKRACQQWLDRYKDISPAELDSASNSLRLWKGEAYGFTDSKNFVTISNTCFSKEVLEQNNNLSDSLGRKINEEF